MVMLSVRYICTAVASEVQLAANGAVRVVHTCTFAPDPHDASYLHGTILKVGVLEPLRFAVGDPVTVTVDG